MKKFGAYLKFVSKVAGIVALTAAPAGAIGTGVCLAYSGQNDVDTVITAFCESEEGKNYSKDDDSICEVISKSQIYGPILKQTEKDNLVKSVSAYVLVGLGGAAVPLYCVLPVLGVGAYPHGAIHNAYETLVYDDLPDAEEDKKNRRENKKYLKQLKYNKRKDRDTGGWYGGDLLGG